MCSACLLLTTTYYYSLLLTTSQALLAIFGGGYWYIKNGAVTEKGAPMPPLTPVPGTAPGWQLSRSKRHKKCACDALSM